MSIPEIIDAKNSIDSASLAVEIKNNNTTTQNSKELPKEIWGSISSYLERKDQWNMTFVNKLFAPIIASQVVPQIIPSIHGLMQFIVKKVDRAQYEEIVVVFDSIIKNEIIQKAVLKEKPKKFIEIYDCLYKIMNLISIYLQKMEIEDLKILRKKSNIEQVIRSKNKIDTKFLFLVERVGNFVIGLSDCRVEIREKWLCAKQLEDLENLKKLQTLEDYASKNKHQDTLKKLIDEGESKILSEWESEIAHRCKSIIYLGELGR